MSYVPQCDIRCGSGQRSVRIVAYAFILVACVLSFTGCQGKDKSPSPSVLINHALAAMGGRKAVGALLRGSEIAEGSTTFLTPYRYGGRFRVIRSSDSRRVTWRADSILEDFCWTPAGNWNSLDGVVSDLPLSAGVRYGYPLPSDLLSELVNVSRRHYGVKSLGRRLLPDGSECEAVRIDKAYGYYTNFYFDPGSGLIAGTETVPPPSVSPLHEVLEWRDYRTVAGVKQPACFVGYLDGKPSLSTVVKRRAVLRRIEPQLFTRPEMKKGEGETIIRFDYKPNRPFIPVSVNGSAPQPFLVDTGSPITVLSPVLARSLHLRLGARADEDFSGRFSRRQISTVKSIRVGGAMVKNLCVLVAFTGATAALQPGCSGLLGYNFLARFRPTVDYGTNILTLAPIDSPRQQGDWRKVSVEIGQIFTDIEVDHHIDVAMLDTGTTITRLSASMAKVVRHGPPIYRISKQGWSGRWLPLDVVRVSKVSLLGQTLHGPDVALLGPQYATGVRSMVGSSVLEHFRVTFDYARSQALLIPLKSNSLPGPPVHHTLSGSRLALPGAAVRRPTAPSTGASARPSAGRAGHSDKAPAPKS